MRQAERDFDFGFSSTCRNPERGEDTMDAPSIASEDLRASTHGVHRLANLDTFDDKSDGDDSEPSGPSREENHQSRGSVSNLSLHLRPEIY